MIVRFLRTQRFTIAILLLGFFLFILSDLKWDLSASYVGRLLGHYKDIGTDFQVQIFSRDPLIVYIDNFVSQDEIDHLLNISEDEWTPSMVYPGGKSHVDTSQRVSESALLPRDEIVLRIEKRALAFQGW
ncbi:Prolyl 4-hydroxylase alpha subunit, partial [Penicillium verrucosum]|uniref:Prolyl 4-hydroxylase alpha subunit n=1 Tax=Penicillium verrucosum TaxID=60171 RepID=UPI0025457CB2